MLAFVPATAGTFIGLDISSDSFAIHVVVLAILLYAIRVLYTIVLLWLFGKSWSLKKTDLQKRKRQQVQNLLIVQICMLTMPFLNAISFVGVYCILLQEEVVPKIEKRPDSFDV